MADAAFPPDCADGTCKKCRRCYSAYVEAKMNGELDHAGPTAASVAPLAVSIRVTGTLDTYGDPGIYNLAQAFRGLFSEHCEREHGNRDTVDSGCPVCVYVTTGRAE